jgi:signal transduction histidine kinase
MEAVKIFNILRLNTFISLFKRMIIGKTFGLKTKLTILIIIIVSSIILISSYLDFHFTKKAQLELYLDRNLYIAKQIDIAIPAHRLKENLPNIYEEIDDWLLSRPFLKEIDVFLFTHKGMELIISNSKDGHLIPIHLNSEQIKKIKNEEYLSFSYETGDEGRLEVIVPLHLGKKVIGAIRVISSLLEVQNYLKVKKQRTFILTFSSIFIILLILSLFFRRLVTNPLNRLINAMSRAENGDLEIEVDIKNKDELGILGKHFNKMLKTIRETYEQNILLLSKVNQFNEELKRKVEEATLELAKRNEELKLLNEALFQSQRQLSQAEKLAALGKVTATMAHQIGTPLNSISGYIQLILQDGDLNPKDRKRLEIIESQLDRLSDSVKNILSFTRQPKPELKPLNINNILEELIHLSEPWLKSKNINLISSLLPDIPLILGDSTHLQTLFLNLMTNAVDAMPNGGTLEIKTQKKLNPDHSDNGEFLEISIKDTGIGITEESKKKIFDPFYTTKKIGEGTGLGLAICEDIIKEHSGRLEVYSEVGKGSTFFIFIPAIKGGEVHE